MKKGFALLYTIIFLLLVAFVITLITLNMASLSITTMKTPENYKSLYDNQTLVSLGYLLIANNQTATTRAYGDIAHSVVVTEQFTTSQGYTVYKVEGDSYPIDSATTLNSWTTVGARVDTAVGIPAPSYQVKGGQYAYKSVPIGPNTVVNFDAYVASGTTSLLNFYFMTNANGKGQMFRLDGRPGNSSGFAITASWTSWQFPTGYGPVAKNVWHHVKLIIGTSTVKGFIDGVSYGTYTLTSTGSYIAIHGDVSSAAGGYFDNISIVRSTDIPSVKMYYIKDNAGNIYCISWQ